MYVVGTAGHVDHGKSTLVKALTGIDPDRLAEEKAREMTIELGFAWLTLTDETGEVTEEVGVVDVPGHRDFIENMLAGVGGIDCAMLIVAADEGVMPQTREHLAILDLLEVKGGVVVLTKVDLIEDEDWLELVTMELAEVLAGTILADAPILPVSAKTGVGLPALRSALWHSLQNMPPKPDHQQPRLPIDRVFTLSGFGTVVTGTLVGGQLQVGDGIVLLPSHQQGRIRGLQTHKSKRQTVLPGNRVAVNVTGIDWQDIQRGQLLTLPDTMRETVLIDAEYRHLADAGTPLKHNMEVKFFIGATEVIARTRILGQEQIEPGTTGFIQLALREPVATVRHDRFILRRPSPGQTLGGGRVLDSHPGRQHRRFKPNIVQQLETLAQGTPAELLLQVLQRLEPTSPQHIFQQVGLAENEATQAWAELLANEQIYMLGKQAVSHTKWQLWQEKVQDILLNYHQNNPLHAGILREELRSRLKLPANIFNPVLAHMVSKGVLKEINTSVALTAHEITMTPAQKTKVQTLWAKMESAGINTPHIKESKALVGEEIYFALLDLNQLVELNKDVVYTSEQYQQFKQQIIEFLQTHQRVTASQIRDLFQTSRKYAIAWLEHFDEQKITRRSGDERELN